MSTPPSEESRARSRRKLHSVIPTPHTMAIGDYGFSPQSDHLQGLETRGDSEEGAPPDNEAGKDELNSEEREEGETGYGPEGDGVDEESEHGDSEAVSDDSDKALGGGKTK